MNVVSSKPTAQTQRELTRLIMVMTAVGRVLMPLRSRAFGININRDMAIAVGIVRMVIAILQICIMSHLNHPSFPGMGWLFHTLSIFIVALYQEIGTILLNAMIIRISEPTSRSSEIAIAHCICHFVCCNVVGDLHQNKQESNCYKTVHNLLAYERQKYKYNLNHFNITLQLYTHDAL